MRTIFDQLRVHATFTPMKPAIMLPDRTITFDNLMKGISSVQAILASLSLDRDRPVGILIDSPSRHLIVLLALMKNGFTFISMRNEQIGLALKCGVAAVLTDVKIPVLPNAQTYLVDDKWFVNPPRSGDTEVNFPDDRIARILFTSGSSGIPKAIGWTLRTIHNYISDIYLSGLGSHSRCLTTYGLSNAALHFALRVIIDGKTIVFSPLKQALQTIALFDITEVHCSANQARSLLNMQAAHRYPIRIEQFSTGGGQLTVEAADEIGQVFKSNIINTYASTEACLTGLAAGEILRLRRSKGNCFVPFANIEIVSDAGTQLPPGKEGRIRVHSRAMGWPFAGNLMETDDVKGDGWFYPGDVGLLDSNGLLIVTGRSDEVINDGGIKFGPEVMEDHLKRHPIIDDVAIARMTKDSGQAEPWIAVVTKQPISLELIQEWIGKNIPGELGSVRFARLFVVDSIPTTATGKVARQQLRDLLRAMN
jgi:acyl-coenzyme A synthetase/AMP-(fatty) acid ligase